MREQWRSFQGTKWQDEVDVRDFIQRTTRLMMAMRRF